MKSFHFPTVVGQLFPDNMFKIPITTRISIFFSTQMNKKLCALTKTNGDLHTAVEQMFFQH